MGRGRGCLLHGLLPESGRGTDPFRLGRAGFLVARGGGATRRRRRNAFKAPHRFPLLFSFRACPCVGAEPAGLSRGDPAGSESGDDDREEAQDRCRRRSFTYRDQEPAAGFVGHPSGAGGPQIKALPASIVPTPRRGVPRIGELEAWTLIGKVYGLTSTVRSSPFRRSLRAIDGAEPASRVARWRVSGDTARPATSRITSPFNNPARSA